MKKNLEIIGTCFASFLFFPVFAWAAPSISSAPSIISDAQSVSISGSDFGTKISGNGNPLRFETWGSGNSGKTAEEASEGWWSDGQNTIYPRVTSINKRVSGRDVLDASIYPDGSSTSEVSIARTFYKKQTGFAQTGKMLLNFWLYTDLSNSLLNDNINTQLKFIHVSSDVLDTWPWGYANFVMPYRAMSLWEDSDPESSWTTMTNYEPLSLGATGIRNDSGSTKNIFNNEGWYNIQIELNQGEYGISGGKETVSIVGPGYSKYGVSSTSGNSAYVDYPEWQAGVANGSVVWYQGTRYNGRTSGINTMVPPDQDSNNWHETYPTDKLNSLIFWLWSQKRGSNVWNFSNQALITSGSIFDGLYYEIVQQGTLDFMSLGAANNNPGTIFQSNGYAVIGLGDQVRRVDDYKVGSKSDHNGKAYRCIADVVSLISPDIDTDHWVKVFDYPWPSSTTKMYFDSIYVDNSIARIEIGNNESYSLCSHREIQIPSLWNNGNISFEINQGTFANGSNAYLFVIDENGIVSDNDLNAVGDQGYPITFSGQADIIAPSAPGGLSVL